MTQPWTQTRGTSTAVVAAGLAALLVGVPAAALIVPVTAGGSLNLTVESSGANNATQPGNGLISALASPGTYTYGDAFSSNQTGQNFGTTASGFYDDFVITIGPGQLDSITSSITLANVLGISNLQVRLYDYTANGSVAPLLTTPVTGSAFDAWSSTALFSGGSSTVDVLPATTLSAGTYVIEVRGTATGSAGGSYTGSLNVSAVPLPAALPLMLSALGLLGPVWRRRP